MASKIFANQGCRPDRENKSGTGVGWPSSHVADEAQRGHNLSSGELEIN